jgi:hypothetical protein
MTSVAGRPGNDMLVMQSPDSDLVRYSKLLSEPLV